MDWLHSFVAESNRIEGIHREPRAIEVEATRLFVETPRVSVEQLCRLVTCLADGHRLRDQVGLNVRVGEHIAPLGGPGIRRTLEALLVDIPQSTPRANHVAYETLHPFTDGNGRSGRALWLWQHLNCSGGTPERAKALGFLHTYYYETLAENRPDPVRNGGER